MADELRGTWESFLTWTKRGGRPIPEIDQFPVDDGMLEITSNTPTTVNGRHIDAGGAAQMMENFSLSPIGGGGSGRFHIRYEREDGPTRERFLYVGKLTIVNFGGKRILRGNVIVTRGGPPNPGDTGTWESTRAGGGVVLREERGKRGKGASAGKKARGARK